MIWFSPLNSFRGLLLKTFTWKCCGLVLSGSPHCIPHSPLPHTDFSRRSKASIKCRLFSSYPAPYNSDISDHLTHLLSLTTISTKMSPHLDSSAPPCLHSWLLHFHLPSRYLCLTATRIPKAASSGCTLAFLGNKLASPGEFHCFETRWRKTKLKESMRGVSGILYSSAAGWCHGQRWKMKVERSEHIFRNP